MKENAEGKMQEYDGDEEKKTSCRMGKVWIVRSGALWRKLPGAYGPWQSVYARFAKWRDDSALEKVFHALSADADMENLSMDSTCVKVHESANGGKKRKIRQLDAPEAG